MIVRIGFTLIALLLYTLDSTAQMQVSISQDTATTCNGTLYDTGGQGATGYQNDEYYILTICPDQPGDVITLNFLNFALDPTNTAGGGGNNADNLAIYDGNSTAAPSLGVYTGTQLQGSIVTCTSLNTSGCITLVFTSNNIGTGVFAANITCATPCQRPTVALNTPLVINNPVKICDGDSLIFDGSASFAAAGFSIVDYIWQWGDGTIDTTSTGVMGHTFASGAGEYLVNLFVIDDNNCINTNLETIQVWAATTPSFSGTSPDSLICLSESVCMDGVVTPSTWTAQPVNSLGGATYLPDDVGQCFTATLDFQSFTPGQTLNNVNDLLSICVSMEHSYMGDLVASIYCPNGQSVILHQQGGGGTNLGDPNQADDSTLIGICEEYCFSPTATNGTWVDNSTFGTTPNVYTNSSGSQSLVPGTYESLNSLSGLLGCPLNGTWTLEFCDLWGADDGFVCDWDIDLHPSLYPALTSFTPSIGNQCDSSFWTATGPASSIITSTSGNCNEICLTPTAIGTYDYTYNVIDDHGCSFDTTLTVTVAAGPTVFAGNDTTICAGSLGYLNAIATGGILPLAVCNYTINMYDTWGDGWNGFSIEVFINGISQGSFTMNTGAFNAATFPVAQGDVITFNTTSGFFDSEVSYEVLDCSGNSIFQTGVNYSPQSPLIGTAVWTSNGVNPNPPNYNFNWTPPTGLNSSTINNPSASISNNMQYVVEVWETGHQSCGSYDTINVAIDPGVFAGNDSLDSICYNDPLTDLTNYLSGSPNLSGSWFDPNNVAISNMLDPSTAIDGNYLYVVPSGGFCPSDTAIITITILQQGHPSCGCPLSTSTTFIDADCFGACTGVITIVDTFATQFSFDGINWSAINTNNAFCAGTYTVYSSEPSFGSTCVDTLTVTISEPQALTLAVTHQNVTCFGDCNGNLNALIAGGTAPYTLAWTGGSTITNPTNICAGLYDIIVTDNQGCTIDSLSINVIEPPLLTIDNLVSVDETCFGSCDGSISITAAHAVLFSIDNGANFQTSNTFTALCTGTYNISVMDTAGCIATGNITVNGPPVVFSDFTAGPQPTTISNTEISFINNAQNASSYQWLFGTAGELGSSNLENPIFLFPDIPGNYDACLVAINAFGCTDSICQVIIIDDELSVFVPNAFSPDANSLNDLFMPVVRGNNTVDYSFLVFDRWGAIVFQTTSPNDGWDGSVKDFADTGKSDVYVWKLTVRAEHDNKIHEFSGHVTLLK